MDSAIFFPRPLANLHCHRRAAPGEIALPSLTPAEFATAAGPCSVGLHPWRIRPESLGQDLDAVAAAAAEPRVLAIGETGLDRVWGPALELQKEALLSQLELAEKLRKPLILHAVRTHAELAALCRDQRLSVPAVFHGFNRGPQIAAPLLAAGFFLSFGQALLGHPEGPAAASLKITPPERLLLETDDAPVPISAIYAAAAAILGLTVELLARLVAANAAALFGSALATAN